MFSRRFSFFFLCLAICFAFASCSSGGDDDSSGDDDDDSATDDTIDNIIDDTIDDDASDDTADDTADDDSDDDTISPAFACSDLTNPVFCVDFEDYEVGALPDSWDVLVTEETQFNVFELTGPASGKALQVLGDSGAGFGTAGFHFTPTTQNITFVYYVKPEADSGLGFIVYVENIFFGIAREIQLDLEPSSGYLQRLNPTSEFIDCDPIPSSDWTKVTVKANFSSQTYDLFINDEPSAGCPTANEFLVGVHDPLVALGLRDYSDSGFGGDAEWDDFYGTTDDTVDDDTASGCPFTNGELAGDWHLVGESTTGTPYDVTVTIAQEIGSCDIGFESTDLFQLQGFLTGYDLAAFWINHDDTKKIEEHFKLNAMVNTAGNHMDGSLKNYIDGSADSGTFAMDKI